MQLEVIKPRTTKKRPRSIRASRYLTPSFILNAIASLISRRDSTLQVEAISANPNPYFEHDENGNLLPFPIYLQGDESFHWEEDEHGYTIIDDPSHKSRGRRKVYAGVDPNTGDLISTGVPFGSLNLTTKLAKLRKHAKPSKDARLAKCGKYCEKVGYSNNQTSSTRYNNVRGSPKSNTHLNHKENVGRRKLMSTSGTLKNLVVLIRFHDHQSRTLPSTADFHVLLNGPGGPGTVAPTGSVNDVFLSNSYGALSINSTIYPWVTVSKPEAYYADNKSGMAPTIFEAIHEALSIMDSDPSINLSEFNTDFHIGDPYIDAITIFHSGYGAEFGGSDCHGTPESSRIWSHSWTMYTGAWTSNDGSVRVSNYHINPGLWDVCGHDISRIGVVAHETAHFLGLPDLYDSQGGNGIGHYCLMSDSWGIDGSQFYPPMLSPWSKIILGWITPAIINSKGDYSLRQSWKYPEVYKIEDGFQPGEYLLIENRQPGSFDILLPRGGLAIWHIDEMMFYGNNNEGYPGQIGWPQNNNHYSVALLQADGRYDLERGYNRGDYTDLFRQDFYYGIEFLFPSSESDPMSGPFPNTDSYGQGVLKKTNHFISGISATAPEMSFSVLPSSPCQSGQVHFELTILTDGYGLEVLWNLTETSTDMIIASGDGYGDYQQYNIAQCLPAKCYTFTITDEGNDGLCCGYGVGGYSVRLNGWKLASGGNYGNQDETDLRCLMPPTTQPTDAPVTYHKPSLNPSTSRLPSHYTSLTPSVYPAMEVPTKHPSQAPTASLCDEGSALLEVTTEGDEFIDAMTWNVTDIYGKTFLHNQDEGTPHNNGGLYTLSQCIPLKNCYTFAIHDAFGVEIMTNASHRGLYSVTLDGEEIVTGGNFRKDQTTMFGDSCHNGDFICTSSANATTFSDSMALFRMEIVAYNVEQEFRWKLINAANETISSAGPFGSCNVNSVAICLRRQDCYEFIITRDNEDNNDGVVFTVMFSEQIIQNYTGAMFGYEQHLFLGTCFGLNFG